MEDQEYRVWHPWTSMPYLTRSSPFHLNLTGAKGSYLYSRDGFRFLDGSAGLWNVSLGHGREDVIGAIAAQLRDLTYQCNIEIRSAAANEFAHRVLRHAPAHLTRVMLHCTGTAAVEAAVMLIRQYYKLLGRPKKVGVIGLDGSYHGCSMLAVALSGEPEDQHWFEPLPSNFFHIPAPSSDEAARTSIEALERLIALEGQDELAAFVYEPIMGVAGIVVPPEWWVRDVISLCRQHGIKVVADEVTTAFGRTGRWFAAGDDGVDVIAIGKGMSGGYIPLAAGLYSEELFAPFHDGDTPADFKYGSTMDGYPAACAAGMAVLDAIEREELVPRAAAMGDFLRERLRPLEALDIVGDLRGQGLMIGVPLLEPGGAGTPMQKDGILQVIGRLMASGLVLHPAGSTLGVLPPLTLSESEAEELADTLINVLSKIDRRQARGRGVVSE